MLNSLRKHATGWVAYIFIGLLVISFAIWGVSDFFRGFGANTVATVGRTEIPVSEFARQYDQTVQMMGRQSGRALTPQQAQMFGIPAQVLGQLVTQATLDDVARQYGLGISNEMLARKIAEDPTFRGPDGAFSRLNFSQILRNAGYTEDAYVEERQRLMIRYQLTDSLAGGTAVPEAYLRALHEYRTEARDISYVVLTDAVAGEIPAPTDAELTGHFEANQARWRAPEYRAISYFRILPADIARPDEVTEEQVRANYDANIGRYSTPERRAVSQIYFDTREPAEAAAAELAEGKTFEDLAAERNLSAADTDLGTVTRDDIVDPNIAEAVFALEPGATSGVIEGGFGFVIARVGNVEAGNVRPFEEVEDEIRQQIATDLAVRQIIQTYDEVEDMRAGGETLAEIAPKVGVSLVQIEAVDRTGNNTAGTRIADLPGGDPFLAAIFDSDVGIENDAVRDANGYVWYEVTDVAAERDRTLDEVRDLVVADWTRAETERRVADAADEVRSRLQSGTALDEIASGLGVEVVQVNGVTRTSTAPAGLSSAALNAAFDGPSGHIGIADGAAAGSKAVIIVRNASVPSFDPASGEFDQVRGQLANQLANDYIQQYLIEMQNSLGVSVNQVALQAVLGQSQQPGF